MSNVLQVFWKQIFGDDDDDEKRSHLRWRARLGSGDQASATIFVIMRRMRAPLIILIVIFAVSVLGLVLIPGEDPAGLPYHMSFFDSCCSPGTVRRANCSVSRSICWANSSW
jgi:voltage-gated potassium channel